MNGTIEEGDVKLLVAALGGAYIGVMAVQQTALRLEHLTVAFWGVMIWISGVILYHLVRLEWDGRMQQRGENDGDT
jgi:hypothetical protein